MAEKRKSEARHASRTVKKGRAVKRGPQQVVSSSFRGEKYASLDKKGARDGPDAKSKVESKLPPPKPPRNSFQLFETKYSKAHPEVSLAKSAAAEQEFRGPSTQVAVKVQQPQAKEKLKAIAAARKSKPANSLGPKSIVGLCASIKAKGQAAKAKRLEAEAASQKERARAVEQAGAVRLRQQRSEKIGAEQEVNRRPHRGERDEKREGDETRPTVRYVHLFNRRDVRDLISLLKQELHLINTAKSTGKSVRRKARNISCNREEAEVVREIRRMECHLTILESFPDRSKEAAERGHPEDLVHQKVSDTLAFGTPVWMGPAFTSGRLLQSQQHKILAIFRAQCGGDEVLTMETCKEWGEFQIKELESSPPHYDCKKDRQHRDSMFLKDVRKFVKGIGCYLQNGPPSRSEGASRQEDEASSGELYASKRSASDGEDTLHRTATAHEKLDAPAAGSGPVYAEGVTTPKRGLDAEKEDVDPVDSPQSPTYSPASPSFSPRSPTGSPKSSASARYGDRAALDGEGSPLSRSGSPYSSMSPPSPPASPSLSIASSSAGVSHKKEGTPTPPSHDSPSATKEEMRSKASRDGSKDSPEAEKEQATQLKLSDKEADERSGSLSSDIAADGKEAIKTPEYTPPGRGSAGPYELPGPCYAGFAELY